MGTSGITEGRMVERKWTGYQGWVNVPTADGPIVEDGTIGCCCWSFRFCWVASIAICIAVLVWPLWFTAAAMLATSIPFAIATAACWGVILFRLFCRLMATDAIVPGDVDSPLWWFWWRDVDETVDDTLGEGAPDVGSIGTSAEIAATDEADDVKGDPVVTDFGKDVGVDDGCVWSDDCCKVVTLVDAWSLDSCEFRASSGARKGIVVRLWRSDWESSWDR